MRDARKLFPGPHPVYGGIVVGEAYRVDQDSVAHVPFDPNDRRTWGQGGRAPLLIDPCTGSSTHNMIVAGPGGFKSTTAISTILHWLGSSVILDPSRELGPMLDGALRAQGKNVYHVGIQSPKDLVMTGIDVLGWIDVTHPEAEAHIRGVVSIIYDEEAASKGAKADDPFFMPMGKTLVTCILAHMLWTHDDERRQPDGNVAARTLATLAAGLSIPENEMLKMLEGIHEKSRSPMARRLAGTLMGCRAPETFSGIYLNAVKGTEWLATEAYANVVSHSAFDHRDILRGDTTIFLNIGLQTLETTPAIARVLVGSLLNTVYMADGDVDGRVLFLLDEAARLGKMKVLETARDAGRKYGITLSLLYQSTGQITEIWGRDGAKAWLDACSWVGYAAIRAGGAGKELSEQLGTHSVLAYSEGSNRGRNRQFGFANSSSSTGDNISTHEIKRALISASEMQQDMREDEIIIVPAKGLPIRCGRAIYFRRPEMVSVVDKNRFVKDAA